MKVDNKSESEFSQSSSSESESESSSDDSLTEYEKCIIKKSWSQRAREFHEQVAFENQVKALEEAGDSNKIYQLFKERQKKVGHAFVGQHRSDNIPLKKTVAHFGGEYREEDQESIHPNDESAKQEKTTTPVSPKQSKKSKLVFLDDNDMTFMEEIEQE